MGLEPTKPNLDRFLAIMSSIVQAAFGFSGIEIVSHFLLQYSLSSPVVKYFHRSLCKSFHCPPTRQTSIADSAGPL